MLALYIINKYGSLIYEEDLQKGSQKSSNDHLRLASTFHGLHAISAELSPASGSGGIEELETDTFRLNCYQTPTGLKFLLLARPTETKLREKLLEVYALFSDYVLKNPFYELDQPVRCAAFEVQLDKWRLGLSGKK